MAGNLPCSDVYEFDIVVLEAPLSLTELEDVFMVNKQQDGWEINSNQTEQARLRLYTTDGRLLFARDKIAMNGVVVPFPKAKGVYLLSIQFGNEQSTVVKLNH